MRVHGACSLSIVCPATCRLLKEGAVTVMDITHTYTPPAGRGQGLAGKLTDAAVANAASMGWQVQASCSYVRDNYFPANKGAAAAFEFDPDTARACLRAK
ncbi:N-acetyltransferase [archaeon]|nr:MAG: N-acetyltransferase [archaeon]